MGKRKSTAEDKAGEMDVDGDSSDDVSIFEYEYKIKLVKPKRFFQNSY